MGNRVALCQSTVILGGRLQLLVAMIETLNARGVEPDVLTADLRFDPATISKKYGKHVRARWRVIPLSSLSRFGAEMRIVHFNWALRRYAQHYDLLFNSSNSLCFLPPRPKLVSYVHFPRRKRIESHDASIHVPGVPLRPLSRAAIDRKIARLTYALAGTRRDQIVISNSRFTARMVVDSWGQFDEMDVIYPPVDTTRFRSDSATRRPEVISLGRFSPNKGQLEQLRIAQRMPDLTFRIGGFVNDASYFEQCRRYVHERDIRNVELHPDLSFDAMAAMLRRARYFLHVLHKEPFGITAVQAAAAGCLPIVHDSGGQRETVPIERLRYTNLDEVPGLISELEAAGPAVLDELRARMQKHVAAYDERVFADRMGDTLDRVLRGSPTS